MQRIIIIWICFFCSNPLQIYGQTDSINTVVSVADDSHRFSWSEIRYGPMFYTSGLCVSYAYVIQKSKMLGLGGEINWSRYSTDMPYTFLAGSVKYKGYLSNGNLTPFLQSSLGYGMPLSSSNFDDFKATGGIAAEIGTGLRIGKQKPFFEIGMSYKIQKGNFEYQDFGFLIKEKITFKRLMVSLGFHF